MRNSSRLCVAILACISATARAQQPDSVRADTSMRHMHGDTARRLAAVSIVATRAERAQPVSATHVDALDVRVSPANSPYELLRQTAGLEVHEQGQGPGFASDASLRGFSSDHATDLALWVDGVPINEPMNGHSEGYNDWSVMFPGGIQDVDVIKGPTSALFGNFAMAGVVNVRTMDRMDGTSIDATGGSFGRAEAMVMTGFDHGPTGGGMFGGHYMREDGFRPNARYELGHAHGRIVHDVGSKYRIDAGAELYGSNWRSAGFLSDSEFTVHDYDVVSNPTDGGFKRRAQERVSVRMLTGNMLWRTTAYATQGRWQLYLTIPEAGGRFEGSGSQTEEEDNRAGLGATTALTWSLSKGELTFGGETRWDRSHYDNYFTTGRVRDSVAEVVTGRQLLGAPFVQSAWNVSDRLRLDLGARLDVLGTESTPDAASASSATHAVFSPKAGAMFKLTPETGVYGNISRGFRSSDGVIADPSLPPITTTAYEAGLKFDHATGASASASLFRMDISDEQTFNPVTLASSSGGRSRRQGFELDWRAPLTAARTITFTGDWTVLDARYRSLTSLTEDGDTLTLDGFRVFNTSRYVGVAALDLSRRDAPWLVRVSGNWVGPYSPFDAPGEVRGAYGLAHVGGMWRFRNGTEINLGVRNLFDRAYPELVAGAVVAPGQPRSLYATVRARL